MLNIFKIHKTKENIAFIEAMHTGYAEWKDCFGKAHKIVN